MNRTLIRKVVYCLIIALLIYPLYLIGAPSTVQQSGGTLAQLRTQHNLSTADLGDIDPTSEAMKLATLGMRGIASMVLWQNALHYKKVHDFDKLSATCNQIIRLQPNFLTVWEFQAHNLAYNVSVEFDDYRHRYHWVKKGTDFLIMGNDYNRNEPRLLYYVGWFVGQKIGRADEHVQFRRMFREDTEFHNYMADYVEGMNLPIVNGPGGFPDNWLVARLWFEKARSTVDDLGKPIRGTSPLVFHSQRSMSRINYSGAIEDEGVFGEAARTAWQMAGEEWLEFGRRLIPSSWGTPIILEDGEDLFQSLASARRELDDVAQSRDRLQEERLTELSDVQRTAWNTPEAQRAQWGATEWRRYSETQQQMIVSDQDIAKAAPPEHRGAALKLAKRIHGLLEQIDRVERYRSIVNYVYWRERCRVEQTQLASEARELLFQAEDARKKTELDRARESYEEAWKRWVKIFEEYPGIRVDITARELEAGVQGYEWTLLQLGESGLPLDFPLAWLLDIDNLPATTPFSDAAAQQIRQSQQSKNDDAPADPPNATSDPTPADPAQAPGDSPSDPPTSEDPSQPATPDVAPTDGSPADSEPGAAAASDHRPAATREDRA